MATPFSRPLVFGSNYIRFGRALARFLVGAFVGLTFAATGAAAEVPKDEPGFTAYVSNAFANSLPGFRVAITGPLMLSARKETATGPTDGYTLDLHNIYSVCVRD